MVINPKTIATLRALEAPGSTALLDELVRSFLDAAAGNLARVEAAVEAGDGRALASAAHPVASSAATLGADALAKCYRDLERCGREARIDDAQASLASLRLEQPRALASLRALLAETA